MKNTLKTFSVLLLAMTLMFAFSACSSTSEDDQADIEAGIDHEMDAEEAGELLLEKANEDADNGIYFEEEEEGAELHFKSVEASDFAGTWESTSGQAVYLYGNIDLTITNDGKWTGNVAKEDIEGTWTFKDPALILKSEWFNASLSFTDDGTLILQEIREDDDEPINTVLTPKK